MYKTDEAILMPRKLTTENGAKLALSGKFFVKIKIENPKVIIHGN